MKKLMITVDFANLVIDNFKALPLKELFFLTDEHIDNFVQDWIKHRMSDDFDNYIYANMTLRHNQHLDDSMYCFFVARDMLDELIVSLAESFYYDEYYSDDGLYPSLGQAFTKGKAKERMDAKTLRDFFQDIFDVMYDRVYEGSTSTALYLTSVTGDDKYLEFNL